ncbi:unnamed protein product [Moneuplotes crassus]|uniref:Uncharacterized protein n=1 Tax=Euplotes crassus TaxID=5936 RepID=A0AAD1TYB7_EUPCR|nr:unnamed protein product [Moneuplotes crassus]
MRILMSSRKHEEPLERRYKSRQNKRLDQTISDMNSSHSILNQPKSIYDDEKKAISRKKKKKVRKVKKIKRKTKAKADKAASHGSKNLYNNEIEQDAKSDGLILNQIFDSTMSFKDSTKSYKVIKKNTILEKMTHKDISKNESKRSRKQSNLISGSKSSLKNETRILPFEKPSETDSVGPKEDNV